MEKLHSERINRNEKRINGHSKRIKDLERVQITIVKDTENFANLLDKLESTIEALNKAVNSMELTFREELSRTETIDTKINRIYTDIDEMKREDGEKWKYYSKLVIGGLITTAIGYIIRGGG